MKKYIKIIIEYIIILVLFTILLYNCVMTLITWKNLPKDQNSSETIEEFIDAKIAVHNNNINAHNDPGQSLDLHRKDTIIDHPAGSVKNDKGSRSIFDYQNYFSDFDSWSVGTGFAYNSDSSVSFSNEAASGNFAMRKEFNSTFVKMDNNYSKSFSVEGQFWSNSFNNSNEKLRFGIGADLPDNAFLGFQVEGTTLYAVAYKSNGTQYKKNLGTFNFSGSSVKSYQVYYDATEKAVRWYIDNSVVDTVDTTAQSIITNFDPFITFNISVTSIALYSTEFDFFNPKFSVDYTY